MFKHILLATDGSASAEHAAQKAFQLARIHGGQITAAFVVDPYPYVGLGSMNPMGLDGYRAAAHEAAGRAFSHLNELSQASGIPLDARLVEESHVVQGILAVADEVAADLIVVGSHGRSGLKRLLAGSVTTELASTSTRPVLVVR
jgi:nucleotide-binding universal stress UspA family protein